MSQQPVTVPTASLHGKVALITGAGRGIGRGCAIELGKRGCSVVVNYANSKSSADEVCQEIEASGSGAKAVSIQADVSKKAEIERLFQDAKKAFGKIDIVMSNSGTESWDKTEEITEEKFDHVFNLNARAQFFVGQAAWKYLENNGRLILMSSIAAGLLGVRDHVLYNASKMAVIGMIKAFATDFGVRGITVNGVAPGGIKSDMFTQNAWHYIPGGTPEWPAEKIENLMAEHCPLKRCAVPEDVARVVAFLSSEDGGWVNAESSPYVLPFVRTLESAGHTVSVVLPDSQRSWIGKAHMVISGPNYGRNTTAVFALSSGTLGAALEASVCGYRAIALSFAFFDRRNLPDVVAESCQQALRVCSWLADNAAWGDGRLYTVNVPLLKGCTEAKTVWTRMLQNEWKQGACFQELPAASAVDDASTEEAKLRKQETRNESGTSNPAAESSKWPRRHFKWAPRFADVYEAVQSAGPGSDGWAVKEGQTSISAIRANFMHTEPEVEALKGKLETARLPKPSKKRKKVDEDVVPVPRDPKRARREASPPRSAQNPYVDLASDFAFSEIGETGDVLLRNLYQIHVAMKSHHRNDPNILAHHLVRAASKLPQVVIHTLSECVKRPKAGLDLLKSNLRAANRAVMSLISGLSRLSNAANGADVQGRLIYAYVRMFSSLIEALGEASSREISKPLVGSEERPNTSKGKKKSENAKPANLKDRPTLNALTSFLCGILDLLDPKVEAHGSLFEGFAYAVLNKLGSRLYTLVFEHARASTLEAEIARANEPEEIVNSSQASVLQHDCLELQQAKLEAPYLIHLLGRLMNEAPAHLGAIISTKTGKPKQANNKGSMKGALALTAKDRLQRTLVNCMFGTEGVDAQSPLLDCLKMPTAPSTPLSMPKVKEVEVQDWFKEEVWRLLGWEVLAKEGDWEVM
ncbi:NAD(P)-binding protein [Hortaea werneckii]|nr:NAD(P)-binding protein [Hortaea werneckii]